MAMETYRTWVRLFELQRYYSWIVDRFHISTMAYQWAFHQKRYLFLCLVGRTPAALELSYDLLHAFSCFIQSRT
jgi:hypothetical protein